jgi:NAD(P)-dependent dehydrogenase (short-subunit alcohol dehydrogenase family)
MKKLEGKVAIVTGASRGVGEYIAVELAKEGCNVVAAARTEAQSDPKLPGTIHDTARELEQLGVRAIAVRCDVTDEDSIAAMVKRTLDEFGRIDPGEQRRHHDPGPAGGDPAKRAPAWRVNVRGRWRAAAAHRR